MGDLAQLRDTVLSKVHERGRMQLEQAQKQHQIEFKIKHEQLLADKEQLRQRQLERLQSQYLRQEQQALNQERQSILAAKQQTLKALFDAAIQHMNEWTSDEHRAFVERVLAKYDAPVTVTLGAYTAQALEANLPQLAQQFPHVTWEKTPIAQEGGLVVTHGQIEDNYLYATLVDAVRQQESFALAAQIFDTV
ncbi:MAG: hypothetical protein Q4B80_04935 [Aerococcaceae bacterium]|nr:hypothetical protein [Aerococcaceae bacterium]